MLVSLKLRLMQSHYHIYDNMCRQQIVVEAHLYSNLSKIKQIPNELIFDVMIAHFACLMGLSIPSYYETADDLLVEFQ